MIALLVAVAALTGCATDPGRSTPTAQASYNITVPADGVELQELGFSNAPPGFSIPVAANIVEQVDQVNTVTVVLDSPPGQEVAAYLRRELPRQGFTITADENLSLLFERPGIAGAFTVSGSNSAISLRYDARS